MAYELVNNSEDYYGIRNTKTGDVADFGYGPYGRKYAQAAIHSLNEGDRLSWEDLLTVPTEEFFSPLA